MKIMVEITGTRIKKVQELKLNVFHIYAENHVINGVSLP